MITFVTVAIFGTTFLVCLPFAIKFWDKVFNFFGDTKWDELESDKEDRYLRDIQLSRTPPLNVCNVHLDGYCSVTGATCSQVDCHYCAHWIKKDVLLNAPTDVPIVEPVIPVAPVIEKKEPIIFSPEIEEELREEKIRIKKQKMQ